MEQILLNGITTAEFKCIIREVILENLNITPLKTETRKEFLSRFDVAKLLGISLTTLNDWSKRGLIQSYRIANRVYYKPEEVEKSLLQVKNLKYKRG